MRIAAKTEYALRAMAFLATCGQGSRVRAEEIAAATQAPRQFLENILGEMRRSGLLVTRRGADGGYELAGPPDAISLYAVLLAVESALTQPLAPPGETPDVVASFLRQLDQATARMLQAMTIADLAAGRTMNDALGALDGADSHRSSPGEALP